MNWRGIKVDKPFGEVMISCADAVPKGTPQESSAILMVTEIGVPPDATLSGTGVPPGVAEEICLDKLAVVKMVPAGMGFLFTSKR